MGAREGKAGRLYVFRQHQPRECRVILVVVVVVVVDLRRTHRQVHTIPYHP